MGVSAFLTLISCVLMTSVNAAEQASVAREFGKGKRLLDQNRLIDAESAWSELCKDERYGPIAYTLLARIYRYRDDFDKSESLYREALGRFPKSVYSPLVRIELANTMAHQGKPNAIPLLKELIRGSDVKSKPGLIFSLAQLQIRLGHVSEALEHYRTLYIHFPAAVEGLRAAEAIGSLTREGRIKGQTYTQVELTERARLLYQAGRFDSAGEIYEAMLKEQPSRGPLRIKLATCRYKERKNEQAIHLLKDILKGDQPLSIRLEALYLLSRLYWRLDRDKDFQLSCQELVKSGNERFKKIALFNLGAYHFEKRRFEVARSYFGRLTKVGADSKTAFQVKWRLAWIAYLTGDFPKSAQQFQQVKNITASPDLQNSCLYWQGRSLVKSNKVQEAGKLFQEICSRAPMSYYGYESADLLKTLKLSPRPARDEADRFPDTTLKPHLLSNPFVRQALELQEMRLHEFALINLNALPSPLHAEPAIALLRARSAYLLGEYAKARSALSCAFAKFMENPPKDAPKEFIEMVFPRVHYEETLRQASKHSLDPYLVWSIIRQESLYDHSAISPAGAVGLMQVMPNASGLTVTSGKPLTAVFQHLMDPHKNLAIGIRILKGNLTHFQGNIIPAVASYNADIRKVTSWMRNNARLKPDEFVEMIPYQETRLYVKRVLAGYRTYRILHTRQNLAELW